MVEKPAQGVDDHIKELEGDLTVCNEQLNNCQTKECKSNKCEPYTAKDSQWELRWYHILGTITVIGSLIVYSYKLKRENNKVKKDRDELRSTLDLVKNALTEVPFIEDNAPIKYDKMTHLSDDSELLPYRPDLVTPQIYTIFKKGENYDPNHIVTATLGNGQNKYQNTYMYVAKKINMDFPLFRGMSEHFLSRKLTG